MDDERNAPDADSLDQDKPPGMSRGLHDMKVALVLPVLAGMFFLLVAWGFLFGEDRTVGNITAVTAILVTQGVTLVGALIGLIRVRSWKALKAGMIITLGVLALMFGLCVTGIQGN